jgi:hypothetical protein
MKRCSALNLDLHISSLLIRVSEMSDVSVSSPRGMWIRLVGEAGNLTLGDDLD